MEYGLPYQGSKNKIAEWVISNLPKAEHFYDLFAGGCAVTHAAMISGKYKYFHVNDICVEYPQMFYDAVNGKYRNEKRIITREEFKMFAESDPYIRLCWSFSNNGEDYLWAEEIEPVKLAACRMLLAETWQERRVHYLDFIKELRSGREEYRRRLDMRSQWIEEIGNIREYLRKELCDALKTSGRTQAEIQRAIGNQMCGHWFGKSQWAFPTEENYNKLRRFLPSLKPYYYYGQSLQRLQLLENLQSLERLRRLESLESLQHLQSLQQLERLQSLERFFGGGGMQNLEITGVSYDEMEILPNSVVYCDPPYRGTEGYGVEFDSDKFFQWATDAPFPVYISEYSAPDDFVSIASVGKQVTFSQKNNKKAIENIFIHKRFLTL